MNASRIFLVAVLVILASFTAVSHAGVRVDPPAAAGTPPLAAKKARPPAFRNLSSVDAKRPKYRDDAIIVKFKAGVPEEAKKHVHKKHGSEVSKKFDSLRLHHIKLKKGVTVEEAIRAYAAEPEVEYAEPDYTVHSLATPFDPYFGWLWGMSRINAPAAWDVGTGSTSVVVAVIDTGIDYNHPDLSANIWYNPGKNVGYSGDLHGIDTINNDSDPMDDHFHGTHVAGTIGAVGNNGVGVTGVNWRVQLLACKFLDAGGWGSISGAIECLQYVRALKDQGINIAATNNSWGGDGYSQSLADAIGAQRDILFMAAAGNDTLDIDKAVVYPGGYDLPNVITVAATDQGDNVASFSNTGANTVHVGAPGTSIYSTTPGNSYDWLQGTSMATPHVTGLAALLASRGNDWRQAKNLILSAGDPLPALAGRTITGRLINASGSLTCVNKPFFALQHLPRTIEAGVPVTLTAISINCGSAAGPVTVTLPDNSTLQMRDDGVAPDKAAGDGVFSATWTPTGSAAVPLTFTSPIGTRTVALPPVTVSPTATVAPPASLSGTVISANSGSYLSVGFSATGGIAPYSWALASGALPDGLSLNASTGELSGTPSASGSYALTVQVSDSLGVTDRGTWSLVLNQGLQPGWPKTLRQRTPDLYILTSSPIFADLDGDGKEEIVVGDAYGLYVFNESTLLAQYDFPENVNLFSTPAVADLFNDGRKQIVVTVGYPSQGAPLYVFDKDLHLLPGFPAGEVPSYFGSAGFCGTPVVADLEGDGRKSILFDCAPNNGYDVNSGKNVVAMVDPQGRMLSGWPKIFGAAGSDNEANPAVADLDRDGRKEIIVVGADGIVRVYRKDGSLVAQWTAVPGGGSTTPPVLADFDGDGYLEIAIKNEHEGGVGVALFDRNGTLLPGWPLEFPWLPNEGMIAADINGDGRAELIANTGPSWDQWNAFTANGASVPNWPTAAHGSWIESNAVPVAGPLGSSGGQDLVFSLRDQLWGYDGAASPLPGFPKFGSSGVWMRSSPALGNLDGSGKPSIAAKSNDGILHVFEGLLPWAGQVPHWPMYGHDAQHTWTLPVQDLQLTPVADFFASKLEGLAPLQVNFTDTTSNAPASWAWNFGDGGASSLQHPSHVYSAPGTYTVSLTSGNAHGSSSQAKVALVSVYAAMTITTSSLHSATVGAAYFERAAAAGAVAPVAWSVSSGSLPAGLALDGSTGVISGTPTGTGTYSFTLRAHDAAPASATRNFSIVVYPAPVVTTTSLPAAPLGLSYSRQLTASGGALPYFWNVVFNGITGSQQSQLPSGLTLDNFSGVIYGTPTATVTTSLRVQVTDANGASASQDLSLAVFEAKAITTPSLAQGTVGRVYQQALATSLETPPYTWSVSSGALPSGLTLESSTGVISGTPTGAQSADLTIQVRDAGSETASKAFTLTVNPVPAITTSSLPSGTVNLNYNQALSFTGGTAPVSWAVVSGTLPGGMTLDSVTGVISGTPTLARTSTFTVQLTDANGATATKPLSITVVGSSLTIVTPSLPWGVAGEWYYQQLVAANGVPPYNWYVFLNLPSVNGTLPEGVTLDSEGNIFGVPAVPGSYSFYARVADSTGRTYMRRYGLVVADPLCSTPPLQMVGTTTVQYDDFPSAYLQAADNGTLQLHAATFGGNLNFTKDLRLSLKGGYDCGFASNEGSSIIVAGRLRITNGTLRVENLRFR